ncbi:MAG TPA: dihydroorotate dehydrogenase [Gemmatimonadaceae bacterium]
MTNRLAVEVAGLNFRNPVLLAAGTAAYGRELAELVRLDALGGIVTKAVSPEPRAGAPAPRVADFGEGMINAVGLANPGVEQVAATELPWLARNAPGLRVIVNVVGNVTQDFAKVVERLDAVAGADAFELNVSCPNVKAGGLEFGANDESLREVVAGARASTRRPLFVKLSPTLADIGRAAAVAVEAGAEAITVVNTFPGLVIDTAARRPALGFGSGGVSGGGLRPIGVLATWRVRRAVRVPILGVGGIETADHALQYIMAGASLIAIGTAALRDPRLPERVVRDLQRWCEREGIASVAEVTGSLAWQ